MDWSRAKNIILAALIFLNLFLFGNVMNIKEPLAAIGEYQKNAEEVLEREGVIIAVDIPSYIRPVGRISYIDTDSQSYRGMIEHLTGITDESATHLSNTKPLNCRWENAGRTLELKDNVFLFTDDTDQQVFSVQDEEKLDKQLVSWIKENKISRGTFQRDSFSQNGDTITVEYVQIYKNIPLYSNRIVFTLIDNKLRKAEGSLNVFDTVKLSKADDILSVHIVLLTNKQKVQGVVQSISLGYLLLQNEELYDTPVWRVILASGEKVWFNAYTGDWLEYR